MLVITQKYHLNACEYKENGLIQTEDKHKSNKWYASDFTTGLYHKNNSDKVVLIWQLKKKKAKSTRGRTTFSFS